MNNKNTTTKNTGKNNSRNGGRKKNTARPGSKAKAPQTRSAAASRNSADTRGNRMVAPPKYRKGSMRIVPLGGLGEIGRNMNVVEYNGHILLIDCGVLFPEEEQPGVDLILPDFSYIRGRLDKVEA